MKAAMRGIPSSPRQCECCAAARVFRYAPNARTPLKVRELSHAGRVDDGGAFAHEAGWRTAVGFERGLAGTRGGRPAALNGVS